MDGQDGLEPSYTVNLIRSENSAADLTGTVHQLPCCIKHTGPCSVSHYFKPKTTGIEVDGLVMEEAYFRGRKLEGTTIPIPQGYSGFVLGKKSDELENKSNSWEINAEFKSLTIWNHDSLPSKDDPFSRAFHWFPVANALHKPVTIEDLQSASVAGELV